MWECTK